MGTAVILKPIQLIKAQELGQKERRDHLILLEYCGGSSAAYAAKYAIVEHKATRTRPA